MVDFKIYGGKINTEAETKAVKCPTCNGFGTLKYGKLICHGCNGKGWIVIPRNIEKDREGDDGTE